MKTGNNYFGVYATISGGPAIGLGGWSMLGRLNTNDINAFTVVESISSGLYSFTVPLSSAGTGYISFFNANPEVTIEPKVFTIDVDNFSNDNIYAVTNRSIYSGTTTLVNAFESVNIGTIKAGDDYEVSIVVDEAVTPSLTGWTNFKATMRKSDSLTSASSAYVIGDWTILNVDTGTSTITLEMSGDLTANIIPEGSSSLVTYSDLQGVNAAGKRKTLTQITATISRNFTI